MSVIDDETIKEIVTARLKVLAQKSDWMGGLEDSIKMVILEKFNDKYFEGEVRYHISKVIEEMFAKDTPLGSSYFVELGAVMYLEKQGYKVEKVKK